MNELDQLIENWNDNDSKTKHAFIQIVDHLNAMDDLTLDFVARPGVSYSLRPRHARQNDRSLFAMVDVIDDDPDERWLSVCFYGDMISDPDEVGDLIPEGLLGDDGYCFDLYEFDAGEVEYLKQRLTQAWEAAAA